MGHTILVADDEPSILLSLKVLLQKAGYTVQLAHDGEEVINALKQSRPSLLLLDAMMPKRDGFDICQTIRANPDFQEMPIIMLTAKSREIDREKGMALGATDYITKPFSTRDLVTTVQKYVSVQR